MLIMLAIGALAGAHRLRYRRLPIPRRLSPSSGVVARLRPPTSVPAAGYRRCMDYSEILYDVTDSVATITLNRPERMNAFTGRMMHEVIDGVRPRSTPTTTCGR